MLRGTGSKDRVHNLNDEYNNTLYDPQYPDDNTDGGVQLDHSKLYITNMPKGLNEEGLECLLAKYGNVTRIYLSKDPQKKFAIVTFEDPSGARAAMMKLNKIEPLRLNIQIAHKKNNQDNKEKHYKPSRLSRNFDARSTIEEGDGVGSTAWKSNHWNVEESNEQYEEEMDDDMAIEDGDMDLEVKLELLKLQEAEIKIKQRRLLLNQPRKLSQSNRCILADGRIVVRNVDRSHEPPEAYSSAAGDSYTLPALQREASRACVACGAPADAYCARCGLVPYCGPRCQRADWNHRHRAVCHNLARMTDGPTENKMDAEQSIIPPAQPLRRPRSPHRPANNVSNRENKSEDTDSQKKFQSRDSNGPRNRQPQNYRNSPRNQNSGRQNMRQNDARCNAEEEESFEPKDSKPNQPKLPVKPNPVTKPEPVPAKTEPVAVTPVTVVAANPVPAKPEQVSIEPKPQPLRQPFTKAGSETRNTAPATVNDVTPTKNIRPKKYLPETLPIGSEVLLSVETEAKTKSRGFVCLALHESSTAQYQMLCEDYGLECEANTEKYKPSPGEMFSYLNAEDGAWYRARCLSPTTAAFIDSGLTVSFQPDNCRKLPAKYEDIVEFCCQLDAKGIKVGDNLSCKLVEKVGERYKVTLSRDGEDIGTGELFRWLPPVEVPVAPAAIVLPEVSRPDVCAGAVLLVEGGAGGAAGADGVGRAFVRPATAAAARAHDGILEDVLLHGLQDNAIPLKEPPQKGDLVIGKFTDGNFYRALCKRTNVRQNKYMLEYIEYGNIEISRLEDLYECPPQFDLTTRPTVVSMVKLPLTATSLSAEAVEYLEKLRDDCSELELTFPNGATTGPSGSEVTLTVSKTRENVNQKVDELSTPEWKKETNGVDVAETAPIMFNELKYLELAVGELEVLDASMLSEGSVSACPARHPDVPHVLGDLSDQMAEYCNSEIGGLPYLPRPEETCIAECPKTGRWMRAVLCAQEGGAGGRVARVCFLDRGHVGVVPVARLRRMLPAFLRLPVLSNLLEVKGFPEEPTPEMLSKAMAYLRLGADGRGLLTVTRCEKVDSGVYNVEAPDLLRAMGL